MANRKKQPTLPGSLHVRKGDTVVVISGKDKGKKGEVLRSIPKEGKVVIQGINLVTRATKPTATNPRGGLIKKEAPIWSSKVMLWDPVANKATRVAHKLLEDGTKVRVSKKSGEQFAS